MVCSLLCMHNKKTKRTKPKHQSIKASKHQSIKAVGKIKNLPVPSPSRGGLGWGWVGRSTPAGDAKSVTTKTDKKRNLSERSEFISLPVLVVTLLGTPKGHRLGVAFFAYFFGEAKK